MVPEILEGLATIVVGFVAFFSKDCVSTVIFVLRMRIVLVDFPATAGFLTPEERAFVVYRKSERAVEFQCLC